MQLAENKHLYDIRIKHN